MTSAFVIALFACLLAPLAGAGLAMMNSGLGRSRSAAHTLLSSLLLLGVGAIAFLVCGAAFLGGWGSVAGGKVWSWLGMSGFFLHGVVWDASPQTGLIILHGMICASLVALIPFGAGSDRWRLGSALTIGGLLAAIVFPVFGHWAWSPRGWLASVGFLDIGASVHVIGGMTALALVWMMGARHAKYNESGIPAAVPGHDAVLVVSGAFVALIGWMGLNCAGSILYSKTSLEHLVPVVLNTILCAAGGGVAVAVLTKSRYGRPDSSLCINGWTSGLVASSAVAAFVHPMAAPLIGLVAGVVTVFAIELMDVHLAFDDPGGTVAVHFLGGTWGLLASGMFSGANWVAQLAGVATLIGFVFPLVFAIVWASSLVIPLRTSPEGDRHGMDLHELGAGAYPEFMMHHNEDSWGGR